MPPPLTKFDEKTSDFFGQKWPFQEVKIFVFFGRLPLGFEDGKWTITVHDPRRQGDQVGGHTQERPRSLGQVKIASILKLWILCLNCLLPFVVLWSHDHTNQSELAGV